MLFIYKSDSAERSEIVSFPHSMWGVVESLNKMVINPARVEVVVAPLALHIPLVQASLKKEIAIATQNVNLKGSGAFTGELSADQLKDFGIPWAIVGHSERRHVFGETDAIVAARVEFAQS